VAEIEENTNIGALTLIIGERPRAQEVSFKDRPILDCRLCNVELCYPTMKPDFDLGTMIAYLVLLNEVMETTIGATWFSDAWQLPDQWRHLPDNIKAFN
jgi:hypothetical protein